MSWAQDEFKTLELGDQRLNTHAVLLVERLASKPTESIPNACLGWAELDVNARQNAGLGPLSDEAQRGCTCIRLTPYALTPEREPLGRVRALPAHSYELRVMGWGECDLIESL